MANSDKFLLWLQIQLGHIAVLDDKVSRNLIHEVKIEVKRAGSWVEIPLSELQN
jgi:hypothetical protein